MEPFIKAFIRSSLIWFALGIVIGLVVASYPPWVVLRPGHAHAMVAGFITMLVFGVGYQLLPRLFGHPLHSRRLATVHLWCANVGLAALVGGFLARPWLPAAGVWATALGGFVFATGAACWIYNLWRTFDAADARQRLRTESGSRPLPTVGD
jgi:cbb3-type cytochrome oxidase subunit 1